MAAVGCPKTEMHRMKNFRKLQVLNRTGKKPIQLLKVVPRVVIGFGNGLLEDTDRQVKRI